MPRLPAETLHRLIRYRGLEASGELLAAATREQLSSVLDLDLWRRAEPASDERFDADRFGEWLETLVETGEVLAARIVSGIDERLVTAGLCRHIRVFDPAARGASWQSDDEAMDDDAARFTGLATEVGGYLVAARRADAWDATVTLLLSLEADHREYFEAVMRGCRRLSNSVPEADGFHDLLTEPEQLLHDLGTARQARRSRQGYLTPAEARLVLEMARKRTSPDARERSAAIRRVAADYLEDVDEPAGSAALDTVVEPLAEAGSALERPRALLDGTAGQPSRVGRMPALLAHLRDADDLAFVARSRELAFLANALVAGCSVQARPFTPGEAGDGAVAVCNLGLEEWQARGPGGEAATTTGRALLPETFLADHDLISVFGLGWAALHEMSQSTADRLVAVLKNLRCADVETQGGLEVLRRELVSQRDAGTPWRARDRLDVIATLDVPAWVSLLGVLGECPVLPAALRATVEGSTRAVSATAFEFISTRSQIGVVRAFLGRLADILLG